MQAFLDDRPLEAEQPTLASVLANAAAAAESNGRIIVEVMIDGQCVDGDALEAPSEEQLGDVEVRLLSAKPGVLAAQALVDASAQLERTRARQIECAGMVQIGKISDAMTMMGECLGDWQAARSVVVSVMQLTNVTTESAESTIEDLAAKLDELKSALTGQDWATVADLLAFDLDEQITSWKAMLDEMHSTVSEGD